MTSIWTNIVFGSLTTTYTIFVAVFAYSIVDVFGCWTLGHAEWSVSEMLALVAITSTWSMACSIAFLMTVLT